MANIYKTLSEKGQIDCADEDIIETIESLTGCTVVQLDKKGWQLAVHNEYQLDGEEDREKTLVAELLILASRGHSFETLTAMLLAALKVTAELFHTVHDTLQDHYTAEDNEESQHGQRH
jgi:hypothetical protein